jgi:hypothetical protein
LQASGTVVEIEGGAVAGATVSAKSCDESPSYNHLFGETQTDGGGGFRLTVDSGTQSSIGCVYLVAAKDRYLAASVELRGRADGITIMLQRLREARGTVMEIDGGPLAGVSVTAGRGATTTTDATGHFVLREVGTRLWLSKSGYVSRDVAVQEGQDVALGAVNLQRAIGLSNRSRVVSRISSADVQYDFMEMWDRGTFCSPCKWIDVETGHQTLEIQLRWSGDTPLTLWAADGPPYGGLRIATQKPGESAVTMLVPPAVRVLLVGIRSATFDPQPVPQPVPFELIANVPDPVPSAP